MGFVENRRKGGNALCFLNGRAEGLSEGKHADYCIVKWLLISLSFFNPQDKTVALSPSNGN